MAMIFPVYSGRIKPFRARRIRLSWRKSIPNPNAPQGQKEDDMKKITGLDTSVLGINPDDEKDMPTLRVLLRTIGNMKADTADASRRVGRIIKKLRDKGTSDLVLENDDLNFLVAQVEKNQMGLTGWMQNQVLEALDGAEKVDPPKAA